LAFTWPFTDSRIWLLNTSYGKVWPFDFLGPGNPDEQENLCVKAREREREGA